MDDKQIRGVLFPWWQQMHPASLLISEYGGLKMAVADMAAFAAADFHACEIKSDYDTLRRLDGQLTTYATLFHRVSVVTGPRHLARVVTSAPEWVAVLVVEPGKPMLMVRAGGHNPVPPNAARALWITEGQALCKAQGLVGYSRLTSWSLPDFIAARLSPAIIEDWVLACLKRRYGKPFELPKQLAGDTIYVHR